MLLRVILTLKFPSQHHQIDSRQLMDPRWLAESDVVEGQTWSQDTLSDLLTGVSDYMSILCVDSFHWICFAIRSTGEVLVWDSLYQSIRCDAKQKIRNIAAAMHEKYISEHPDSTTTSAYQLR
jgi:hypothetical protein